MWRWWRLPYILPCHPSTLYGASFSSQSVFPFKDILYKPRERHPEAAVFAFNIISLFELRRDAAAVTKGETLCRRAPIWEASCGFPSCPGAVSWVGCQVGQTRIRFSRDGVRGVVTRDSRFIGAAN